MIYLEERYIEQIKRILSEFSDKVDFIYAFGSRVRGTHKTYSDLDLAVKFNKNADDETIFYMRNALEESSLPIRVDLIDLDEISDEFESIIKDTLVEF